MKKFVGGLMLGVGIGLLICGLVASSLVSDFERILTKYDRQIDDFYEFSHSYSFQAVRGLVGQTSDFYKSTPLLRQALETFGMGQLGQLLQDIDDNFEEIIEMSEDLYDAKSSAREARSMVFYLEIGGIAFIGVGIIITAWASREI